MEYTDTKNYSLFVWNLNLTGPPILYLATLALMLSVAKCPHGLTPYIGLSYFVYSEVFMPHRRTDGPARTVVFKQTQSTPADLSGAGWCVVINWLSEN